jgi:hypothetical protein
MSKKIMLLVLNLFIVVCIFLIGAAPIISVAIAGSVANAAGCQLDEGSIHPCLINGADYGDTLYSMGVLGWLMLASIPLALGLLVIYAVVLGIIFLVRALRRPKAAA